MTSTELLLAYIPTNYIVTICNLFNLKSSMGPMLER